MHLGSEWFPRCQDGILAGFPTHVGFGLPDANSFDLVPCCAKCQRDEVLRHANPISLGIGHVIAHAKQSFVLNDLQHHGVPDVGLDAQWLTIQQQIFNDHFLRRLANVLKKKARLDEVVIGVGPGRHNVTGDFGTIVGGDSEALMVLGFRRFAIAKCDFDDQALRRQARVSSDRSVSHAGLPR